MLNRRQIIRAIRIRDLLVQADAETAASPAYRAKAIALARGCPNGPAVIIAYDQEKGWRP